MNKRKLNLWLEIEKLHKMNLIKSSLLASRVKDQSDLRWIVNPSIWNIEKWNMINEI